MGITSIFLVLGALLAGDITLSRLHYQYMVHETVTVPKLAAANFLENATADDKEVCSLAEKLSSARGAALESSRGWHPVGNYAAELFDALRGSSRISRKLGLAKKSCKSLIESVDKTNFQANVIASVAGALTVACLAILLRRSSPRPTPTWRPEWKAKLRVAKASDSESLAEDKSPPSLATPSKRTPYHSFEEYYPVRDQPQAVQQTARTPKASHEEKKTFVQSQTAPLNSFTDLYKDFDSYHPDGVYYSSLPSQTATSFPPVLQASEPESEEEIVVPPKLSKRRSSISRIASDEEAPPKTPRRKSSKPEKEEETPPKTPRRKSSKLDQLELEASSSEWSPLTVDSLSKSGVKQHPQMMGGIDVGSVIMTPRRRSANSALGSAPGIKRSKSDA